MARPRTPTALKLVKGTAQPCRTNKREPTPKRALPVVPEGADERLKSAWDRICKKLGPLGVLALSDELYVEECAKTLIEIEDLERTLLGYGSRTYQTTNQQGDVMYRAYPEVAMLSDAKRRYHTLLNRGGGDPAGRSKVSSIGEEDSTDPWAKL